MYLPFRFEHNVVVLGRSELILGTLHKQLLSKQQGQEEVENDRQKQKPSNSNSTFPVEEQSSTKIDYLQHKLTYINLPHWHR